MKVMVLGATGLTGAQVLEGLLTENVVSKVVAPVRRAPAIEHPKLQAVVVDFEDIEAQSELFSVDVMISCLGTTIKKAGSKERFRTVDHDYVLTMARMGREQGAQAFILMSAMGASSSSPVFYNRVKGELEDDITALGFPRLSVYQPGLLMSERKEQRSLEAFGITMMKGINPAMVGPLRAYRGIDPAVIARAMVNELKQFAESSSGERNPDDDFEKPLIRRLQYDDMQALARG